MDIEHATAHTSPQPQALRRRGDEALTLQSSGISKARRSPNPQLTKHAFAAQLSAALQSLSNTAGPESQSSGSQGDLIRALEGVHLVSRTGVPQAESIFC